MKWITGLLAAVAAMTVGVLLRTTPAFQSSSSSASDAVTVLIMLGERAQAVERWDGSIRISGGTLLAIEGRNFSAGDTVTGAGVWKAVTRRDEVAPYADIHYTEMRPGEKPGVFFHPIGLYVTVSRAPATRISVQTVQGSFEFGLAEIGVEPTASLGGRVSITRVPSVEKLSAPEFEDDEPALAILPDGAVAAAWVAYRDRAERILLRIRRNGLWSAPEEITPKPKDLFRCSLAADAEGNLWAFWSERDGDRWHIWAREKKAGAWQAPERLSAEGTNTFHRAAISPKGEVFVVWQSFRGRQSDIFLRVFAGGTWSREVRLSDSPANDWEPAVAAGPDGAAYIAWDSYDRGNYDVHFRSYRRGELSPMRAITSSPRFQAHASVTVDKQGRPWVAWDESGVNWAKDQGFLIPTPLATPVHQERSIRLATWDGMQWLEPRRKPSEAFPDNMRQNAEHPQLAFDGAGGLAVLFRHWTRRNVRTIGSPLVWENYLTYFDGTRWLLLIRLFQQTARDGPRPREGAQDVGVRGA